MNKGLSNFQIDEFIKNEENEDLKKKLYGNLFDIIYSLGTVNYGNLFKKLEKLKKNRKIYYT